MAHVLLQISWLAGALRVIIAALATSRASCINPNNLRQVRGSIFSLLLVWFAGDMKSERPSKDDRTTLSLRSLGRENCFAVTRRCFLRTKSEKLFPSRPSFLRRRTSTGFVSRTFSCWPRARIRKILALAE